MPGELLSICIHTRNRSHLLKDLLISLHAEIAGASALTPDVVKIYVSDNASTDATRSVAQGAFGDSSHFTYWRNTTNLGAILNVIACANKATGRYQWIIGDDEIVRPNALRYVLDHLRQHAPSWFINSDGGRYGRGLSPPREFANIREFVRTAAQDDPETLMTAGTISLNIFRADCFDASVAEAKAGTSSYAHFFGLMTGLKRNGGSVFMTSVPTIKVRPQRPAPVDGEFPPDSDKNWADCMSWLKAEFDLTDLDVHIQSKLVSRNMVNEFKKHPFQTIKNNSALLMLPGAYPRILKRLLALWK
jgi:glycosyltransferase involved in cell wall biosynthesis